MRIRWHIRWYTRGDGWLVLEGVIYPLLLWLYRRLYVRGVVRLFFCHKRKNVHLICVIVFFTCWYEVEDARVGLRSKLVFCPAQNCTVVPTSVEAINQLEKNVIPCNKSISGISSGIPGKYSIHMVFFQMGSIIKWYFLKLSFKKKDCSYLWRVSVLSEPWPREVVELWTGVEGPAEPEVGRVGFDGAVDGGDLTVSHPVHRLLVFPAHRLVWNVSSCVFKPVMPFGKLHFINASTNATDDHKYSPLPSADFDIAEVLVSFSAFIFT